jgi:hypothetical protein
MRLSRILLFLKELQQWVFFNKAIKVMRVPFINLGFTLYSLFWIFSIVGGIIYGGEINDVFFTKIMNDNISWDYIWLNFNDFASGIITLQTMMLFNNW